MNMTTRKTIPLLTALLTFAVYGCQAKPQFKEPPADSFSVQAHQVKIGGATEALQGAAVTKEFFSIADVQPFVGRFFSDGDYAASAPSTVDRKSVV